MDYLRFREKEKRFYEKIGVRKLKELILKLTLLKAEPRISNGYYLKRGNGLQDLKEHRKFLYYNGFCHSVAFVAFASSSSLPILLLVGACISQAYLVMIQRYNYIRIEEAIEKHQGHEKQKIKNLKIHILEKDAQLKPHQVELYKYQLGRHKNLSESLDDILEHASYLELLYYKKLFNQLEEADFQECHYYGVPSLNGFRSNKTFSLVYSDSKKMR